MSSPYVGEIRMFGGNFAPAGWAFCSGQVIPISQNDTLFNLIGTTYGGDGQSTFALPNLQSRVPIHAGQGPGLSNRILGEEAGNESVTLTVTQIPAHSHAFVCTTDFGQNAQPQGNFLGQPATGIMFTGAANGVSTSLNAAAVSPVGGNQPHDNMIPFLVVSFIISLF
jgi:microcystin-dependent protein